MTKIDSRAQSILCDFGALAATVCEASPFDDLAEKLVKHDDATSEQSSKRVPVNLASLPRASSQADVIRICQLSPLKLLLPACTLAHYPFG